MKSFNEKWNSPDGKKSIGAIILFCALAITVVYTTYNMNKAQTTPKDVSYIEFQDMVKNQTVKTVYLGSAARFKFIDTNNVTYTTDNPRDTNFKGYLLRSGVDVQEQQTINAASVINGAIDLAVLLFLFSMFRNVSGKSSSGSLGGLSGINSNIGDKDTNKKVNFDSIAGNEEAKEEMKYLVDFLKNPKKYNDMGARMTKGVLFVGPPGTGKTLMAKGIAGEANVPFYSASGSDFVELFVGNGARKVRALFKKAKASAPCIVFIDEIDAVGQRRGRADSNTEGDQTLNALLSEIDGFNGSEGVVVIASTNLPEKLDPALVRPGRFDKKISINLPDLADRIQILKLHAERMKISSDVDFETVAKMTIGFSGAGLESLLNEAAILAVIRNKRAIGADDIDKAYLKVLCEGDEKKNKDRDAKQTELVAWHEAGHALCTKLTTDLSVPKVTIVPMTSGEGGVTIITPNKEGLHTKQDLYNDVMISYGGRVGELLYCRNEDEITTGAYSDIKNATDKLRNIVVNFGMSEQFGMINLDELRVKDDIIIDETVKLGKDLYEKTRILLSQNKDTLKLIADRLIEKETICEDELNEIISSANK